MCSLVEGFMDIGVDGGRGKILELEHAAAVWIWAPLLGGGGADADLVLAGQQCLHRAQWRQRQQHARVNLLLAVAARARHAHQPLVQARAHVALPARVAHAVPAPRQPRGRRAAQRQRADIVIAHVAEGRLFLEHVVQGWLGKVSEGGGLGQKGALQAGQVGVRGAQVLLQLSTAAITLGLSLSLS